MNAAQKIIYKIDSYTPLFKVIETKRAQWFDNNFNVQQWLENDPLVLDIGSGVGDITKILQKYTSQRVIGLDIEDFRRSENRATSFFDFLRGDCNCLPFQNNVFDVVTLFWTLHHISKPINVLNEVNRVLKPSGQLIILEDLVDENSSTKKIITQLYDKIVNLEFSSHPHSNMSLKKWSSILSSNFPLQEIELRAIPWFTPMKLLQFGLLRYKKQNIEY